MRGRDFLRVAKRAVVGQEEADWRAAVIGAYYALMLECRDALVRWGRTVSSRDVHRQVRIALLYSGDRDLKDIGKALDKLSIVRTKANYEMQPQAGFATDAKAHDYIQQAETGLATLAAIDGDAARRAAAVASLPP